MMRRSHEVSKAFGRPLIKSNSFCSVGQLDNKCMPKYHYAARYSNDVLKYMHIRVQKCTCMNKISINFFIKQKQ